MISTNFNQPTTSKYFLQHQAKAPSPPEATLYANAMPQTPPSSNTSPSDHHSHLNVREVRQRKQPLYVPAALRPTEVSRPANIPNRPRAPDTPPASQENSFDSGKSKHLAQLETAQEPTLSRSPEASVNFDELRRGLSRAGSDCLEFNDFPAVTGPPTTAHWKPDELAFDCAICRMPFSFFFRRHHCRSCGDVVCDGDSRKKIPLDENARYNVNGWTFRACNKCADEWEIVQQLRLSRPMSSEQNQGALGQLAGGLTIPQRPSIADPSMAHSMARSQGAMEWSTF